MTPSALLDKVLSGGRLERDEALCLLREASLLELAAAADRVRRRFHPDGVVTFVADTNPNYTNVCDTECLFCAFWRPAGAGDAYTLDHDELISLMKASYHNGATTVLLQGGHNPDLPLSYYTELVARVRREVPGLHLHAFSAPEIAAIARYEGLTTREVLQRLWEAGLRTIPGGGAEILSDRVRRRISPLKIGADDWIRIMREAHRCGFKTTATMMFGHVETDEDIVEHLDRIRRLQDETGGFLAFIPWTFKPRNTFLERWVREEVGGERYLRVLALSRVYLDNFTHVQGSWFTQGKKMGSISLHFGASDLGGTLYDENVLGCAENRLRATIDELVHMIRSAGFRPAQRDTFYNIIKLY